MLKHEIRQKLNNFTLSGGQRILTGEYPDGGVGIMVETANGMPLGKLSVSLETRLPDNQFYAKIHDQQYLKDIYDELISLGLIENTGRIVSAGYVKEYATVFTIL